MTGELTNPVRELLGRIATFEKLELLVLLHRTPRPAMPINEAAAALALDHDAVRQAAIELNTSALVEVTARGELQLLPPTSRDRDAVRDLVQLYDQDRVAVIKTLGEIAMQRIRDMAAQTFVDAIGARKK